MVLQGNQKRKKEGDGEVVKKHKKVREEPEEEPEAMEVNNAEDGDDADAKAGAKKNKVPQNHKEQKDLRVKRKLSSNPGFAVIGELKKLWEEGRQRTCSQEQRDGIVREMMAALAGRMREVIFQHDGARLVQFCIQHGTPPQRDTIFTALLPTVDELCEHTYSKFVVPKMLQYGGKEQRSTIIKSFYGKVKRMMRHKTAASVLSLAYMDYANAQQRAALVEEFYGPEFALFKSPEKRTLDDIFADQPEAKKTNILHYIRDTLRPLMEKGRASHHIIHRLLLEFITHAAAADAAEMVESVREQAVEMLHTKEGARVALLCLWQSDAKGRKAMIKTFKPYVAKICMEEYGHVVLLGLFDCVDDTVLVKKSIIATLTEEIDRIAADKYGAKVLLYLLCPRSSKHFAPDVLALLKQGDGNPHSKKDATLRRQELAEGLPATLHQAVQRNAAQLLGSDGPHCLLVNEILLADGPARAEAIDAVARVVAETPKVMEQPAVHRVLKNLVHSKVGDYAFARALAAKLAGSLASLAEINRCSFVVLSLLECGCAEVVEAVRAELKPAIPKLKELTASAGATLLYKASRQRVLYLRLPSQTLTGTAQPQNRKRKGEAPEAAPAAAAAAEAAPSAPASAKRTRGAKAQGGADAAPRTPAAAAPAEPATPAPSFVSPPLSLRLRSGRKSKKDA